jgi:hypothetical protein
MAETEGFELALRLNEPEASASFRDLMPRRDRRAPLSPLVAWQERGTRIFSFPLAESTGGAGWSSQPVNISCYPIRPRTRGLSVPPPSGGKGSRPTLRRRRSPRLICKAQVPLRPGARRVEVSESGEGRQPAKRGPAAWRTRRSARWAGRVPTACATRVSPGAGRRCNHTTQRNRESNPTARRCVCESHAGRGRRETRVGRLRPLRTRRRTKAPLWASRRLGCGGDRLACR